MVKRSLEKTRFESVLQKLNAEGHERNIFSQYTVKISAGGSFYSLLLYPKALNDLYIVSALELAAAGSTEVKRTVTEAAVLATLLDVYLFLYCM